VGDFRAELAALVAAYDEHGGKWPQHHEEALWQAVERARAALAQPEPAGAAATAAVAAAIAAGQPVTLPSGAVIADPAWLESRIAIRAADPLERQALRPIPVSERLPEPKDCDAEGRCWWGDAGDDQFVPSWRLCEQPDDTHFTHWLPAHALPLPEVE